MVLAALIADIILTTYIETDRFIFLAMNLFLGPSCGFFLGVGRIIHPQDKTGSGTFYLWSQSWTYAVFLFLVGIIDFALVVYTDSKVIEPNEKRAPVREPERFNGRQDEIADLSGNFLGKIFS